MKKKASDVINDSWLIKDSIDANTYYQYWFK